MNTCHRSRLSAEDERDCDDSIKLDKGNVDEALKCASNVDEALKCPSNTDMEAPCPVLDGTNGQMNG